MSREPLLIVDGYNLLHRLAPKRLLDAPGGLERARAAVVRRVETLLEKEELPAAVVVFDAAGPVASGPNSTAGPQATPSLRVLFATDYPDADSMIEEMVRRHSSPRRLTVVSSDRRVMDAARKRGAQGLDCDAWLDQREKLAGRGPLRTPEPAAEESDEHLPGADESRYWLREFGFGDPERPGDR